MAGSVNGSDNIDHVNFNPISGDEPLNSNVGDRGEDAFLTDNNTLGSGNPAANNGSQKDFRNVVTKTQDFEDGPGRRVDPPTKKDHAEWYRHTRGIRAFAPKEGAERTDERDLYPGARYVFIANGIRCTHENTTPYVQKVKLTIPPYHEPSSWDFRSDWKPRQEPCFLEIKDLDDDVVAQAQFDRKGELTTKGNIKVDTLTLADQRMIAWSFGFFPMINFVQDDLSRKSAFNFIARTGFEFNCMLFGKTRYEEQNMKPGETSETFQPEYQYIHDMRSGPASLGATKMIPYPNEGKAAKNQATGESRDEWVREASTQAKNLLMNFRPSNISEAKWSKNIDAKIKATVKDMPIHKMSKQQFADAVGERLDAFIQQDQASRIAQFNYNNRANNFVGPPPPPSISASA